MKAMAFRPESLLMLFLLHVWVLAVITTASKIDCPCGWQLSDSSELYTNRIYQDFSQYPSAKNLASNSKVEQFTQQWVINGFLLPTDDPAHAHEQQFNADSVSIADGYLQLKQLAYSQADAAANNPVNIAGIQTKTLDVLHGSFRTVFKITGASGGSCGSFFWYHNDSSEIDVEIVTGSNSVVNDTVNFTSHPSLYPNGEPIPNATLAVPFTDYTDFHTYRFDCTPQTATYYLDGEYMHQDHHNVPHYPGSLQLNLWADGNRLWSGTPSTTDVTMSVSLIEVYYNTSETDDGSATSWFKKCNRAGGPSNDTICLEGQTIPIASMTTTQSSSSTAVAATATDTENSPTVTTDPGSPPKRNGARKSRKQRGEGSDYTAWVFGLLVVVILMI